MTDTLRLEFTQQGSYTLDNITAGIQNKSVMVDNCVVFEQKCIVYGGNCLLKSFYLKSYMFFIEYKKLGI